MSCRCGASVVIRVLLLLAVLLGGLPERGIPAEAGTDAPKSADSAVTKVAAPAAPIAPIAPAAPSVTPATARPITTAPCVLVLNSYDPDYIWTRTIVDGIRQEFTDEQYSGTCLSVEYLDARRFPDPQLREHIAEILAHKYHERHKPDLVIAVDNAAYDFMRERGKELFGDIPVVFCGVSGVPIEELRYAPNTTGVAGSSFVIHDTLMLIRTLLPENKKLVFLADYSTTGQEIAREVKAALASRRYGFENIEFTPNSSAEDIASRLASLSKDSVVIHLFFSQDRKGQTFSIEEGARFFASCCPVPMFGSLSLTMGEGIVGGKLTDGGEIGKKAASIAVKILRGKEPGDIPLVNVLEMPWRFDYRQLQRFHLSTSDLPKDAEILFRPPSIMTLYTAHFWLFWIAAGVFVLESLLIGMLLRQRNRLLTTRNDLHATQQLYHSLLNDPPVCICRIMPNGNITYVNQYFCQFFGVSREELDGRPILELVSTTQQERVRRFLLEMQEAQLSPVRKIELEYPGSGGGFRYLRWVCRAVYGLSGRLETIQCVGEDITDLKQTYDVLIESERRFRTVADFTCGWESWLNHEDELLYISPFCETVTGYSPKEFRQCPQLFLTTVFPDDRRLFERHWNARDSIVSFSYRLLHKSGRVVWADFTGQPVRDSGGASLGRRVSIRDVTARKNAEEALRDSEESLRITLQSISDAVISADLSGSIRSMNAAAEQLCETLFSEVAGIALGQALHLHHPVTGERLHDLCERVISGRPLLQDFTHLILKTPEGNSKSVTVSGAPIRNSSSIVSGAVLVLRDITQQIEMEQQLRHTQKMDAVGQLAGGVAHDFNNMLGGIMGAAELILAKDHDNAPACRYAEIIIRTAERASRLTEQLLAFSRKGGEHARPVDVHAVIRDTREILESSLDKRIQMQTLVEAEDHTVRGDESQLENALINLCINARDAMPEGGDLVIETSNIVLGEDAPSGADGQLPPGYYLQLTVRDTGAGIEPGIVHKIFDPFFTTKEVGKGTGLGLSAVYGIVRLHHGAITVSSEPGKGSTFRMFLPVSETQKFELENHLAGDLPSGEGTILLVDDEMPIRQTAQLLLEGCGYVVHTAENGQQSLELFRQNPASYDLVILDMVMPDLDGAEVFRIMKTIRQEVRVIISSGYLRDARISTLLEEGVCSYLKKPYRLPELAATVAQVIRFGK